MTLIGYLRKLRTVREAVEDPWLAAFLTQMIHDEIVPTIPLPADETMRYAQVVFERFHNPEIRHELKSIALNSVSKFRARLLPSILDRYATTHQWPKHLMLALAALIVFYRGRWKGESLPINDHPDMIRAIQDCWSPDGELLLTPLLANSALWGTDLAVFPGVHQALRDAVDDIHQNF